MVYVLNQDGQPLMPTKNHAKVRVLVKDGKAKVVRRTPFTIQLTYNSTHYTQPVSLGVDAGSRHICNHRNNGAVRIRSAAADRHSGSDFHKTSEPQNQT